MAKKQKPNNTGRACSGSVTPQPITDTIEKNFMPYAMSVIVSRAISRDRGLKPAHRKLLYTMWDGASDREPHQERKRGGADHEAQPHGDLSIYETLVRLTRGNETLLHPLVDSRAASASSIPRT